MYLKHYRIGDLSFFLTIERVRKIYFGSVILPRVFTLIVSGEMSKFKSIGVDVKPENEFNIENFKDSIEVQEW